MQLPLLATDLTFCAVMIGTIILDAALIIYVLCKSKDQPKRRFRKSFSTFIDDEFRCYKRELNLPEYVFWWITRAMMIGVIIYGLIQDKDFNGMLVLYVNLVMSFIVPLSRVLFWKLPTVYHIPLRVQSFIDLLIIGGSFFGQGLDFNTKIDNYDKLLHLISGCVVVWIGSEIYDWLSAFYPLSHRKRYPVSAGLSMQVMVVWEAFEFIADFCFDGSVCQNWFLEQKDVPMFIAIFGQGAMNAGQNAVLDTNVDVITALVGCVFGALLLLSYKKSKELFFYDLPY